MNPEEKNGWIAFSQVVNNFLGNSKSPEYKEIVKTSLDRGTQCPCIFYTDDGISFYRNVCEMIANILAIIFLLKFA